MHTCEYTWTNTSIGGFAHCSSRYDKDDPYTFYHPLYEGCGVVDTALEEKDCIGYIDPEITRAKEKAKREKDKETKRLATIEYLKKIGKYVERMS